jgi:hypothetical protein
VNGFAPRGEPRQEGEHPWFPHNKIQDVTYGFLQSKKNGWMIRNRRQTLHWDYGYGDTLAKKPVFLAGRNGTVR